MGLGRSGEGGDVWAITRFQIYCEKRVRRVRQICSSFFNVNQLFNQIGVQPTTNYFFFIFELGFVQLRSNVRIFLSPKIYSELLRGNFFLRLSENLHYKILSNKEVKNMR